MPTSIVLVEDSLLLRKTLRQALLGLGQVELVAELTTEADATLWLRQHRHGWNLAIVDLILEQGTGMGVLDECRHRTDAQKVVVFSDYASESVRTHCLRLGADAVFQKGTEGESFLAWCADFCRAP